jgi:hypothetical protein
MYVQSVSFATDVLIYAIAERIHESAKKKKPAPATRAPAARAPTIFLRRGRSRATPRLEDDDVQQTIEEGAAALYSSKTDKAATFSGLGVEGTPKVIVVSLSYYIPNVLN